MEIVFKPHLSLRPGPRSMWVHNQRHGACTKEFLGGSELIDHYESYQSGQNDYGKTSRHHQNYPQILWISLCTSYQEDV